MKVCDAEGKVNTVRYEAVNAMLLNEFVKEHRRTQEQERELERLNRTVASQQTTSHRDGTAELRTAGDDYWAGQLHLQINEALAWVEFAQGKPDEALKLMRSAADDGDAIEKRPVTPGSIVPAREQLGDLLLEMGRAKEALQEFKSSLAQTPQRRGALNGIADAAAVTAK